MLEYAFMQRGLLAGLLLGAVIPLVGMTVVQRRLSMIGDALSHASLAGVATGLVGGVSLLPGLLWHVLWERSALRVCAGGCASSPSLP